MSSRVAHALALLLAVAAACSDRDAAAKLDGARVARDAGPDSPDAAEAGPAAADAADGDMAEPLAPGPASYAAVVEILTRSCGYIRCHGGPLLGGALNLVRGTHYAHSLVNVTACQYDRMKRVEPYHPERSWLMVKLTASFRDADDPLANYIDFEPEAGWDPDKRSCRDRADDGQPLFGQRMPLTAPNMLPEAEIETIRSWIAEGAPFEG